ncbi:MAG: ZIP family metal transporter [Gammaproteobacteria bacterium]|nr:ZIP family metal transporter [Gammaproteobacteria bacterium]MCH9744841.1 ZIP family metal transporter [Gammaproteobacteria bacterium]
MSAPAWHSYFAAAILSVALMICHYLSPYLKRISFLDPRRIASFAGGVAVGYVFLHMLPELVESRDHIHKLLDGAGIMTPFKDLVVFVVALVGFEVFYFIERYASRACGEGVVLQQRGFRVHLAMYFIYNFLITYTMFLRVQTGLFYSILFAIAMGLHFILTDNHFKRYFPDFFNVKAHIFLVFGLLMGYVISLLMYPMSIYITAILIAFLSGSILYNAFSQEIPMNRKTSTVFFFLGTLIMGALLVFQLRG